MGYEYIATPTTPFTPAVVAKVLQSLTQLDGVFVVRESGSQLGLAFKGNSTSLEAVTIIAQPSNIYVVFHSFQREQREQLLSYLMAQLCSEGFECEFVEA